MKRLTFEVQKAPGFRFNLVDLIFIFILFGVSAGIFVWSADLSICLIPLYLGGSFFLFCNVFRIGNRLEPFWYVPFALAVLYSVYVEDLWLFWLIVIFFLEPLKWVLILYRIKKARTSG